MIDQSGNEYEPMTKEEAEASVEDMSRMMEWFEGTCELCGSKRMFCSNECVEKQLNMNGEKEHESKSKKGKRSPVPKT